MPLWSLATFCIALDIYFNNNMDVQEETSRVVRHDKMFDKYSSSNGCWTKRNSGSRPSLCGGGHCAVSLFVSLGSVLRPCLAWEIRQ